MTVADLIRVYEGKTDESAATTTAEDETYQWNRFVRDFNADPMTRGMKDRMKAVARLWSQVRDNPSLSKQYLPHYLVTLLPEIDKDRADPS